MNDLTQPVPGEETIPPAPVVKRWSKADAGLIFDGAFGRYNDIRMVDMASQCGWVGNPGDDEIVEKARIDDLTDDQVVDIWDQIKIDVELWLNDNVAPEGYDFGWHEGDFVLWSEELWCKVGNLTCTDLDHDHTVTNVLL